MDFLRRLFRRSSPSRHVAYRPAHRVMLPEHGPDVPAGFFMSVPLEMPVTIGSACREGVEPKGWAQFVIQESRS